MPRSCWAAALLLLCMLLGPGCSKDGSPSRPIAVQGTVLLDGQPMPEGDIAFQGSTGQPPIHGTIADGRFTLQAVPGSYRVAINHYRASGRMDPYGKPQMISDLPARYNIASELTAEVAPGGSSLRFELASR